MFTATNVLGVYQDTVVAAKATAQDACGAMAAAGKLAEFLVDAKVATDFDPVSPPNVRLASAYSGATALAAAFSHASSAAQASEQAVAVAILANTAAQNAIGVQSLLDDDLVTEAGIVKGRKIIEESYKHAHAQRVIAEQMALAAEQSAATVRAIAEHEMEKYPTITEPGEAVDDYHSPDEIEEANANTEAHQQGKNN
jgi:hypothetical protein